MTSRVSRRRFLALAGGASAAALLPSCGDAGGGDRGAVDRVLVLGAGIAGLTVANALTAAGVDVEVLEARDRVGGRTWTADLDGAGVDLGAAWIHGTEGNPVACFARANGIAWRPAEVVDAATAIYDAGRGFLAAPDLVTFLLAQSGFEEKIGELRRVLGPSASLSDGAAAYLDGEGLTGDERRFADFAIRQGIGELFYGGPAEETSLEELLRDEELSGGNQFPDGGYRRVVDRLAAGLEVRLGRAVSSVSWGPRGVVARSDRGEHRGSHAVVTVPLGVLKAGRIRFDPPLPAAKQGAIDRLAMASFEKVVLFFDAPFWSEAGRRNVIYLSRTWGEYPVFFDLTPFAGRPALLCFSGGSFARALQGRRDAEIVARVREILAEISGDGVPAPTHATVTHWGDDPWALGSYSFVPVGASRGDMDALAEPVAGRLLFAGEATVPAWYGTVHAAMGSGLREARRLLGRESIDFLGGPAPDVGCA